MGRGSLGPRIRGLADSPVAGNHPLMTTAYPREPGYADLVSAATQLQGRAIVTPVIESVALNERTGGRLLCKAESLQATAPAFRLLKVVREPAGAVVPAAAFSGVFDCRGKTVAVIGSGASVETAVFGSNLQTLL